MCCDTAQALVLLLVSVCCQSLSLGVLTGVNAAHNNINFVVALVLLLVSMCCDTAQALVFLPVSMCCDDGHHHHMSGHVYSAIYIKQR